MWVHHHTTQQSTQDIHPTNKQPLHHSQPLTLPPQPTTITATHHCHHHPSPPTTPHQPSTPSTPTQASLARPFLLSRPRAWVLPSGDIGQPQLTTASRTAGQPDSQPVNRQPGTVTGNQATRQPGRQRHRDSGPQRSRSALQTPTISPA